MHHLVSVYLVSMVIQPPWQQSAVHNLRIHLWTEKKKHTIIMLKNCSSVFTLHCFMVQFEKMKVHVNIACPFSLLTSAYCILNVLLKIYYAKSSVLGVVESIFFFFFRNWIILYQDLLRSWNTTMFNISKNLMIFENSD
jgi:hypothetical protein